MKEYPDTFYNPVREALNIEARCLENDKRVFEIAEDLSLDFDPAESRSIVFVQRRKTTLELAMDIFREIEKISHKKSELIKIDGFHAGMTGDERREKYEKFKRGDIHVLVATKAFGMGMDIPNIHRTYHYGPSSSFEDFLQEVGRAGRDREKDFIPCKLFYTPNEFDKLRELSRTNALRKEHINRLYDWILENRVEIAGKYAAVIPFDSAKDILNHDKENVAANLLRMSLYYLERMGRITLGGYMPRHIEIEIIDVAKLRGFVVPGNVAHKIAEIIDDRGDTPAHTGIADMKNGDKMATSVQPVSVVALFFKFAGIVARRIRQLSGSDASPDAVNQDNSDIVKIKPERKQPKQNGVGMADGRESTSIILNVSDIIKASKNTRSSGFFKGIVELEKSGVIRTTRELSIRLTAKRTEEVRHFLSKKMTELVFLKEYLAVTSSILARLKRGEFVVLSQSEMDGILKNCAKKITANRIFGGQITKTAREKLAKEMRDDLSGRAKGVLHLLSSQGVVIHEKLSGDKIVYNLMHTKKSANILLRLNFYETLTPEFLRIISEASNRDGRLMLFDLIGAVENSGFKNARGIIGPDPFKVVDECINLLRLTGYVHCESDSLPMAVILEIPKDSAAPGEKDNDREILKEISIQMSLKEYRIWALETFCFLSDKKNQELFLSNYFNNCDSVSKMDRLIGYFLTEYAKKNAQAEEVLEKFAKKGFEDFSESLNEDSPKKDLAEMPSKTNAIVLAGPGSGKTRALLARVAFLLHVHNVQPSEVLLLSFNRAIITEIRIRLARLFRSIGLGNYSSTVRIETFHSFALKVLRQAGIKDVKTEDLISTLNAELYAGRLINSPLIKGVTEILVDEFQDMNSSRYEMLKYIASLTGAAITVVGDDDQDIVGFDRKDESRHSRHYFESFKKDFVGEGTPFNEYILSRNYRSGSEIVHETQKILTEGKYPEKRKRLKKDIEMKSASGHEAKVIIEEVKSGFNGALKLLDNSISAEKSAKDIAVLCRSNIEVFSAWKHLKKHGDEFRILVQGELDDRDFINHRVIAEMLDRFTSDDLKTVLCSEELELNKKIDEIARKGFGIRNDVNYFTDIEKEILSVIYNAVNEENNGDVCFGEIAEYIQDISTGGGFFSFLKKMDSDDLRNLKGKNTLLLSTVHKIKGLEFDTVFILPSESGLRSQNDEISEEYRLYYVAATRAKNKLVWFMGKREELLLAGKGHKNNQTAFYIEPDGKNIFISAPAMINHAGKWEGNGNKEDVDVVQKYLREVVGVGDPVFLEMRGKDGRFKIMHKDPKDGLKRTIGCLSDKKTKDLLAKLPDGPENIEKRCEMHIVSIQRAQPDAAMEGIIKYIPDDIIEKDWFFTPLISGIINLR